MIRNAIVWGALAPLGVLLLSASARASDLLGSAHGGSARWDFCYGKADSAVLPPDPRSLVQPGVNESKAVHFNAYWKDCHVDPEAVQEEGAPTTCGELRQRFYKGDELLKTGGRSVGSLFTGNDLSAPESLFGLASTFSAEQYNKLWQIWGGFWFRPDNFDELVGERYGSGFGPDANPYPRPGENPNATNGGTGKLPEMFTQLRNPDGSWSGRIGVTCHACHSGVVGSAANGAGLGLTYGGGSSLADLHLFLNDMLPLGYPASLAALANLNRTRGTNNASDINLAFLFPDQGFLPPGVVLGLLNSGSTAGMDTPAWWNMGHRPLKFVDGVFPMDAPRVDMVFYTPLLGLFGSLGGSLSEGGQDWMRENGPALNTWVESLKSPSYPLPINQALAEQGSVLFHTLNMWAPGRNNPVPRPEGNGSCASCHGAYAPRYVNDPAFLETPALEGMAAYIVPLDVIGTDPVRLETNNDAVQLAGANNFFGYPPTAGTDQDCGPQNRDDLRGDRELGYLAPPLYGVWATAPYFHNGSVPNIWEVLKPSDRKPLWRRVSKPARADQVGKALMGFDTDLARAYDAQKLGWKYDAVKCEWRGIFNPSVSPYINCDPNNEFEDPLAQQLLAGLYSNLILTWNILFPPTFTNQQEEDRKIFNTHMYGQGNEGHAFNAVLTDAERLAIIEYLKTL
jgi:endo-cleaving rubber dioxygenase